MKATLITIGRGAAWSLVRVLLAGILWANDGVRQDADQLVRTVAKAKGTRFMDTMWQPAAGSWADRCETWIAPSTSVFDTHDKISGKLPRGEMLLEERVHASKVGFDVLRPPWLR